jgi:L-asparaginase
MTQSPMPILVLTTGGTIDKTYFDAQSSYEVGESQVRRLLELGRVTAPFEIEEVLRKDSLEMTDEDRAEIASRVAMAAGNRVVITHGTDTMAMTAEALGVVPEKTVVLVGALAPARFSESDASFNLGMAFATAQTAAPGTYITMNGTVFRAGEVVKRDGAFVQAD